MKVYWISYGYRQADGSLGLGNATALRVEPILNQQGVNELVQQVQMDQGLAEVIILSWRELEVPGQKDALQAIGQRLAGAAEEAPPKTSPPN